MYNALASWLQSDSSWRNGEYKDLVKNMEHWLHSNTVTYLLWFNKQRIKLVIVVSRLCVACEWTTCSSLWVADLHWIHNFSTFFFCFVTFIIIKMYASYEILTAVFIKTRVFYDLKPCRLVHIYQNYSGACSSSLGQSDKSLKMEAEWSSKTLQNMYQSKWPHPLEDTSS